MGDSGALEAHADGATVQAQDLAESVLLCLPKTSKGTCETAIDYFEALSMVPVSERAPFFAEPLCRRLLHALLQQACYPANFISWSRCIDDDEDDFKRFRCGCISVPDVPRQWLSSVNLSCPLRAIALPSFLRMYAWQFAPWLCRENAMKEALGILYCLLRAEYLQECGVLAASSRSWQHREVALYALRYTPDCRHLTHLNSNF